MITGLSLILILVSAIIHPIWNILLKQSEDKVIFYFYIHFLFTVFFSFILFIFPIKEISASGWIFVALSSFMHFFYQIFLCRTYELGDISLTYPIVRSTPIFVAIFGFIFLKEIPSQVALIGIILIIAGTQIINQDKFSVYEFFKPLKKENRKIFILASMTALFSALYSTVDKRGVIEMHPILFFYLFFAFSGFLFGIYALFFKEKRRDFLRILITHKFNIALASVLEFTSYVLILYAFCLSKVAYVVALRQLSVVFGVIFGAYFLKEQSTKVRILASVIIFIGAFLILVYG